MTTMTAGELIILGRQLTKIGTSAMRSGGTAPDDGSAPRHGREPEIPAGLSMVGADVFAHPATSITEIAARTGLRQSYVSDSVARLRDQGVVETAPDPADRRRTLVRLVPGHPHRVASAAAAPVEEALAQALGNPDPAALAGIIATLAELARRLRPRDPGPVARYLADDTEA
jgi:DNA-binding MarR family transcriptional regulator